MRFMMMIRSFALLVVLGAAYVGMGNLVMANQAMAQDAATSYPKMAPAPAM
jgi:hypothetical protein